MSMITASRTFCPAPWNGLNINQMGDVSPCQYCNTPLGNVKKQSLTSILQGPQWQEIKQSMTQGQWHPYCGECERNESLSGYSTRMTKPVSADLLQKIEQDPHIYSLEHLALNWSNLCNLACTYCNHETSTEWQRALGIPMKLERNRDQDLLDLAMQYGCDISNLTLGGGEPLLQPHLPDFLQYLDRQSVQITVTTNLSVPLQQNKVYQCLKEFPHACWLISFDTADPAKFEYVRRGASWQQFERNLDFLQAQGHHVVAHPAYCIYSAFELQKYYQYLEQHNLKVFWCELSNPWPLDVRRLSLSLRMRAYAEIQAVTDRYQGQLDDQPSILLGYGQSLLDPQHLVRPDYDIDTVTWHRDTEKLLVGDTTFEQLWPDLATEILHG